jgi:hypothetical protein
MARNSACQRRALLLRLRGFPFLIVWLRTCARKLLVQKRARAGSGVRRRGMNDRGTYCHGRTRPKVTVTSAALTSWCARMPYARLLRPYRLCSIARGEKRRNRKRLHYFILTTKFKYTGKIYLNLGLFTRVWMHEICLNLTKLYICLTRVSNGLKSSAPLSHRRHHLLRRHRKSPIRELPRPAAARTVPETPPAPVKSLT